jgi:heterodisulfide reductase subunit C
MVGQLIRVSELDASFKQEVVFREPSCALSACYYCGTCTGGCPTHALHPEHDPRKIVRMINLGMKGDVLSSVYIWYCSEKCFLCEKFCPQSVMFSSIWNVLRHMVVEGGYPLPISINEDGCSGCGICVASCPNTAMELYTQNGNRIAHVVANLCKGCGACSAACPSGAISIKLFEDENISAQIEALAA